MASVILWCSQRLLYFLSWWQVSYCGVHRTTELVILIASVLLWCSQDYCTFYPDEKCHIVVFTGLLYFLSWWQVSYCGVHRDYCTFYPDGKCHIVVFTGLLYFLSWWQVSYCGVHKTTVLEIQIAKVSCSQDYCTFYPHSKCHIVVSTGLLYFLSWWEVSYCGVHRTTVLFILMASVILWCSQDYCTFYPDDKCHIVVFTGLMYFLS